MNLFNGTTTSTAIAGFSSFIIPNQHRQGKDKVILEKRRAVYQTAKERNSKRWSGDTRDWTPVTEVWLNPPKEIRAEEQKLRKVL